MPSRFPRFERSRIRTMPLRERKNLMGVEDLLPLDAPFEPIDDRQISVDVPDRQLGEDDRGQEVGEVEVLAIEEAAPLTQQVGKRDSIKEQWDEGEILGWIHGVCGPQSVFGPPVKAPLSPFSRYRQFAVAGPHRSAAFAQPRVNPHPPALGVQPETLIVAPVLMKPASTLAQAAQTLARGTKPSPALDGEPIFRDPPEFHSERLVRNDGARRGT